VRIVFIGTGEIGVPTLRVLQESENELVGVVTQPDKPVGRDQRVTPPPIKKALLDRSSAASPTPMRLAPRTLQPAKIKDPRAIEEIRGLEPDVIVVVAYGQILPRAVLEIPKVACLNLHASLLPRWRGAAPIQAAIAAGERETGMTAMYMDEGLDTGDILLQRKIDILPNDTGGSLHDRLAEIAPDALVDSLRMLANGSAPRVPQDKQPATYAPKLNREAGRINWNEPAAVIERKIRAYNPWPGAFTEFDPPSLNATPARSSGVAGNQKLKIFSAKIVDLHGKPGEILRREEELIIATSDRALSLSEIQLEGKRRMRAAEFLRGHSR
jgi:methionyl-tRNA formyltransferase